MKIAGGMDWEEPGGYRLRRLLGRGSFGEVWEAEAPGGLLVAIKVIPRAAVEPAKDLVRDVVRSCRLPHEGLIKMHAVALKDDNLLIVSELADRSLREEADQRRKQGRSGMAATQLIGWFRPVAAAIDFLHDQGILHGSVKPSNLLFVEERLKLADAYSYALMGECFTGTPLYMAPEQWHGRKDLRTDQYALACVWAELRRGQRIFQCESFPEMMKAHTEGRADLQGLSKKEQAVLRRALAADPAKRFATCREFMDRLAENARD